MEDDIESGVDTAVADAPEPISSEPEQPQVQAEPEPQQSSPWDAFKRLPEFQGADDRSIAARLYNAMEREKAASRALAQYQQVLPYAQEWIANRSEIEEFRKWKQGQPEHPQVQQARQVQQQAQQQTEQPGWWNPPKVREAYKRYLVKDENGREVVDPEAPLDARHELYEYQQYKADFAKKFLEDPQGALGPMIQDMAAKQAQQIVQQQFEQHEKESYVTNVEQENRDWLFDPQTGNVTPEGLLVHKYIEEARERGINGPQQRWQYAIAMTERDMLARLFDESQAAQATPAQAAPAPAAAPPAPPPAQPAPQPDLAKQNMDYLRREAARKPSRSAGNAVNDPRAPRPKRTFEELLREDASSRGLM
jgi:hypothetical protein